MHVYCDPDCRQANPSSKTILQPCLHLARYCDELARLVLTIQRMRSLRDQQGEAGKDSRSFADAAASKRQRITECLAEIDLWREQLTLTTPALTPAEVKDMLVTGLVPVDKLLGREDTTMHARQLYCGKLYLLARTEVTRLNEELGFIPKEVICLDGSLKARLRRTEAAVAAEEAKVGAMPIAWDHLNSSFGELLQTYSAPPSLGTQGDNAATPFHSHGTQFALLQKELLLRRLLAQLHDINEKLPDDVKPIPGLDGVGFKEEQPADEVMQPDADKGSVDFDVLDGEPGDMESEDLDVERAAV
jgi:hypothetical protein